MAALAVMVVKVAKNIMINSRFIKKMCKKCLFKIYD